MGMPPMMGGVPPMMGGMPPMMPGMMPGMHPSHPHHQQHHYGGPPPMGMMGMAPPLGPGMGMPGPPMGGMVPHQAYGAPAFVPAPTLSAASNAAAAVQQPATSAQAATAPADGASSGTSGTAAANTQAAASIGSSVPSTMDGAATAAALKGGESATAAGPAAPEATSTNTSAATAAQGSAAAPEQGGIEQPAVRQYSGATITLYVGNMSVTLKEGDVMPLLKDCGRVVKWNRVSDPDSGMPRSFGFVDYGNEDSALLAIELLDGLEVGKQKLVVKPDSRSAQLLEDFSKAHDPAENPFRAAALKGLDRDRHVLRRSCATSADPEAFDKVVEALTWFQKANNRKFNTRRLEKLAEAREREQQRIADEARAKAQKEQERLEAEKAQILRELEGGGLLDGDDSGVDAAAAAAAAQSENATEQNDGSKDTIVEANTAGEEEPVGASVLRSLAEGDKKRRASESRRSSSHRHGRSRSRSRSPADKRSRRSKSRSSSRHGRKHRSSRHGSKHRRRSRSVSESSDSVSGSASSLSDASEGHNRHRSKKKKDRKRKKDKRKKKSKKKKKHSSSSSSRRDRDSSPRPDTTESAENSSVVAASDSAAGGDMGSAAVESASAPSLPAPTAAPVPHVVPLVERIPTDPAQLYAFSLNWNLLEANGVIQSKVRPWLAQKTAQYMGEADEDLINFIMVRNSSRP